MRRKIAKRKRRELLRYGATILEEGWIREPGWSRKDIGYGINFQYREWNCSCAGRDELEAYQDALWIIKNEDTNVDFENQQREERA